MGQFFEAYRGEGKVSPLVTQLPWTHHLIILSQTRHPEEREFYLFVAIKERIELVDSAGLRGRE